MTENERWLLLDRGFTWLSTLPSWNGIMAPMNDEKSGTVACEALPKVIIAILNHNYARFVGKAIESALEQTYANVDVIVIDDGSTDNSLDVISQYQNRVKLYTQENKGVVASRNRILELAKDVDYLIQLDADDYLDKYYVEKMLGAATKAGGDIIYCQAAYFGRVNFVSMYPSYDLEKLKHENYIIPCALLRMQFVNEHVLRFDEYLSNIGYEDWDFMLGACLAGAIAVRVDEPLYHYRKHALTESRNDEQENDLYKLLLVRHHIWQKYNAIYPQEFSYFSAEIDLIYKMLRSIDQYNSLKIDEFRLRSELYSIKNSRQWRYSSKLLRPLRKIHAFVKK